MSAFFVTATGTGIGKTFVTRGLIKILRRRGEHVSAIKPVISGFSSHRAAESDSGVLLRAMGEEIGEASLARISPWRFEAPLSPDMAAGREGRDIDYDSLLAFCRERIAGAEGPLFVEGVGGVMVPLDMRHTVRDWMAALGLPLVLVTGSYLGAISHTLTALAVLEGTALRIAALVVNETEDSPVPLAETLATLGRFAGRLPIVSLRHVARHQDAEADFARLWQTISSA